MRRSLRPGDMPRGEGTLCQGLQTQEENRGAQGSSGYHAEVLNMPSAHLACRRIYVVISLEFLAIS